MFHHKNTHDQHSHVNNEAGIDKQNTVLASRGRDGLPDSQGLVDLAAWLDMSDTTSQWNPMPWLLPHTICVHVADRATW